MYVLLFLRFFVMCGEQFCGQVLLREARPGKRLSEKKGLKQFGFGFDPPPPFFKSSNQGLSEHQPQNKSISKSLAFYFMFKQYVSGRKCEEKIFE